MNYILIAIFMSLSHPQTPATMVHDSGYKTLEECQQAGEIARQAVYKKLGTKDIKITEFCVEQNDLLALDRA